MERIFICMRWFEFLLWMQSQVLLVLVLNLFWRSFFLFEMQTAFDFKSIFGVHSVLLFSSVLVNLVFIILHCTYALNLYAHMNVIFCEVSCQYWIQVCMHMKWNGIGRLFFTHKLLCHGIYFHYFSRVALFFCSLINYFLLLFVAFVPTITNLTNWHWRLV